MDYSNMTSEQLQEASSSALAELARRQDENERLEEDSKRTTAPFKKLVARARKVKKRADSACRTEEITVNLPIRFTINITRSGLTGKFFKNVIVGKLLKSPALTRTQHQTLQFGIDNVIGHACEIIIGLFPQLSREVNYCNTEMRKIREASYDHDVSFLSITEEAEDEKRK